MLIENSLTWGHIDVVPYRRLADLEYPEAQVGSRTMFRERISPLCATYFILLTVFTDRSDA